MLLSVDFLTEKLFLRRSWVIIANFSIFFRYLRGTFSVLIGRETRNLFIVKSHFPLSFIPLSNLAGNLMLMTFSFINGLDPWLNLLSYLLKSLLHLLNFTPFLINCFSILLFRLFLDIARNCDLSDWFFIIMGSIKFFNERLVLLLLRVLNIDSELLDRLAWTLDSCCNAKFRSSEVIFELFFGRFLDLRGSFDRNHITFLDDKIFPGNSSHNLFLNYFISLAHYNFP